jgi:DNA mismatch repair protein MutS
MTNIVDLHIPQEILPLFDFTHNDFSKEIVINLLRAPLHSKDEILSRQEILKGFIANLNYFKEYSYSRTDLFEVYTFLSNYTAIDLSRKGFKLRLLLSEKERHQNIGKYIQLVMLLHKLQTYYLNRINTSFFPENYKSEIQWLNDFLTSFHLAYYEELIREQRFKLKHINELATIISGHAKKGELTTFWKRYFLFEAYLSISRGIIKQGFSFPTFSDTVLSFEQLYHPLLKQPVKNNFTTSKRVVLLTGPNMSGKSTFLKAIGLCIYLGHLGIGVPASKAEMPFFDSISISIHHHDDIVSGYSHFMTEVMNLKKVVLEAAKDKKCFAVFDELFRGTNIEDAVEISITTIKGLSGYKNSFFFISTHLYQLKEVVEAKSDMVATYFIDCVLKDDTPRFTYLLQKGWSDMRVGRILFDKEGLNELLNNYVAIAADRENRLNL